MLIQFSKPQLLRRSLCSFSPPCRWNRMTKNNIMVCLFIILLVNSIIEINSQSTGDAMIPITFLHSAVPKGAVCLDGSAPSYSYVEGSGNGSHGWIVYLQGGGWCTSIKECYHFTESKLGSSIPLIGQSTEFTGLLNFDCRVNPDFCNWHKVFIYYCDGSTFMSDIQESTTNLTFRGRRIFNVMMEEMLAKGMGNAHKAILSGTSAGALATILHCDKFRKFFSNATRVGCISDSGFMINGKGLHSQYKRETQLASVIKMHDLVDSLSPTCISKTKNPNLCLFPEYLVEDIRTPLFIVESAFDQSQLSRFEIGYNNCTSNLKRCNYTELGIMQDFRTTFIDTLVGLKVSSTRGMFIHSCYLHGHIQTTRNWACISVANKTIVQAALDWYYDRHFVREIDTKNSLPQNCTSPSCPQKPIPSMSPSGFSFI